MKIRLCTLALIATLAAAPSAFAQAGAAMAGDKSISGHASMAAEGFIADNITRSLAILNNPALSEPQRSQQFEALLLSLTDMKRVAIFTLGPYAKTAPQADQDGFIAAFQTYSAAVYRSYFNRFSGQSLTVTGSSQRAPDDFIVSTRLVDPNDHSGQAPLVLNFRVRTDAGKPVVTDFSVMGVWLALSQQDEFGAFLSAPGGSVAALTANLREVTGRYH
jgi:phospholipid transport system substrate-binding protein